MSPYPARINRDDLIHLARQMIEDEGAENLSLGKLAKQIGVKTPSLYRHIASKTDLLREVNTGTMREMMARVAAAMDAAGQAGRARLIAAANAYRAYAQAHPRAYLLLFASDDPDVLPDNTLAVQLVLPAQAIFAELAGADRALNALRGLWALMHGFVTLELAGQFRRTEGTIDTAWDAALAAYLDGWHYPSP